MNNTAQIIPFPAKFKAPPQINEATPYPGSRASALELLKLAQEFHKAHETLLHLGKKGRRLSWAPSRFVAIHAIELYLNAFLRHNGYEASQIRGLHHNLTVRLQLAKASGLKIKSKTERSLEAITNDREYVEVRYAPELTTHFTCPRRLVATLSEVAGKVSKSIN